MNKIKQYIISELTGTEAIKSAFICFALCCLFTFYIPYKKPDLFVSLESILPYFIGAQGLVCAFYMILMTKIFSKNKEYKISSFIAFCLLLVYCICALIKVMF